MEMWLCYVCVHMKHVNACEVLIFTRHRCPQQAACSQSLLTKECQDRIGSVHAKQEVTCSDETNTAEGSAWSQSIRPWVVHMTTHRGSELPQTRTRLDRWGQHGASETIVLLGRDWNSPALEVAWVETNCSKCLIPCWNPWSSRSSS